MAHTLSYEQILSHIRQLLTSLGQYVDFSNQQGTSDINVACENLVLCLMNKVYGYNLVNYNGKMHKCNAAGIDLVDYDREVCVQVTSKHSSDKFKKTLEGYEAAGLKDFDLKFFIIQDDAKSLHNKKNEDIGFDGKDDVIDFNYFYDKLSDLKDPTLTHELHEMLSIWLGTESYYNYDNLKKGLDMRTGSYRYSVPKDYIPRKLSAYITKDEDSFADRYLHPEKYQQHTFTEYVNGEVPEHQSQYWLLMAAGQRGKSYEARNLAFTLETETGLFPVLYEAKRFTKASDLYLPFWWDEKHTVLIIDGYDEPEEDLREKLLLAIEGLRQDRPALRIVLTTRRNFIRDTSVLEGFYRLSLNDLNYYDVDNFVNQSGVNNPKKFLQLIDQFDLYSQIYVPFYLKALLEYYKTNGTVPDNKYEIYKFLIDESFLGDTKKKQSRTIDLKARGNNLMRKFALVLQFTGKKELSAEELYGKMGFSEDDIHSCERYSIFHRADNGKYCFEKNSYQMFYAAEYLMEEKSAEEILDIISYREYGSNRIRPEWYDVYELLLSVMEKDNAIRKTLLDWTISHHPEALLNVDCQTLEQPFCYRLFKLLLFEYKRKGISSSPDVGWHFDQRLANLCRSRESMELFTLEYENETEIGSYLYLLSHILWFIKPSLIHQYGFTNRIKSVAYRNLEKYGDSESRWYQMAYTPLGNEIFNTKEDIDKLISLIDKVKVVLLKDEIYRLIRSTEFFDNYVDFSIEYECNMHDFYRDGATHRVSRKDVYYVLGHVKEYDSLTKVWSHYHLMVKRSYSSLEEDEMSDFRNSLLANTAVLLKAHPDLISSVDAAWLAECKEHFYRDHISSDNKIYLAFRHFFEDNDVCGDVQSKLEEYHQAHQGKFDHDKLDSLRAKLALRLNPGDISKYIEGHDTSEDSLKYMLLRLRSMPCQSVAEEASKLVKTLYPDYEEPHFENSYFENKRNKDFEQALDRKSFKAHVKEVVEKYTFKTSKELRLNIKDDDATVNDFIYSYLYRFNNENTKEYDIESIMKSLSGDAYYNIFLVNLVTENISREFTPKQINNIKKAIIALFSMKRLRLEEGGVIRCFELAIKFDFDLPSDVIIKHLRFAGIKTINFDGDKDILHYANEKLGVEVVKPHVVDLLSKPKGELPWYNIEALIKYAAEFELSESYKDVCRHISETEYSSVNLTDKFLSSNLENGLEIMMNHFDLLPPESQLYVARKASKNEENVDWIISSLNRARANYDSENNKEAIKFLLRYGDEQALAECMVYIQEDCNLLCRSYEVPPFRFTDVKFLPQMLQILQLTWEITDHFNSWYSQIMETIQLMASQNNAQFDTVVDQLTKLAESDKKYSTLYYFIGELRGKYDPRITNIPQMKIKDVMKMIED